MAFVGDLKRPTTTEVSELTADNVCKFGPYDACT